MKVTQRVGSESFSGFQPLGCNPLGESNDPFIGVPKTLRNTDIYIIIHKTSKIADKNIAMKII